MNFFKLCVGILYVYEELDYETKSQYLLTLRATDSISKTYAEVPVNIIIIDVNDCIPKFSADFYNITVAENTPVGSYVLQVAATDNDTGNKKFYFFYIITTLLSEKICQTFVRFLISKV